MTGESAAYKIERWLQQRDASDPFFLAEDASHLDSMSAVHMALSRMCGTGRLTRASTGVYCAQANSNDDELRWVNSLAKAVSRRSRCNILLDGLDEVLRLGLPTQPSQRHIYLSDGGGTSVLYLGHTVQIKRVSPRLFAQAGSPHGRVIQALYWLGPEAVLSNSTIPGARSASPLGSHVQIRAGAGLPGWVVRGVSALLDQH